MWGGRQLKKQSFVICCVTSLSPLLGCTLAPHGEYRFWAAVENEPVAYRNVRSGESLKITVNFQNLSEKSVPLAGAEPNFAGLYLRVSATSDTGFFSRPIVRVGLRDGQFLHSANEISEPLWFDKHNPAVQDLASVGPVLLHLNADSIQNSLTLLSNEAAFNVELPVDWRRVPSGPPGTRDYAVPVTVTLKIDFAYVDRNGKQYAFSKGVKRVVQAVLINDLRPGSGFQPTNGPVNGTFQEQ